jgi:hypothetical protein
VAGREERRVSAAVPRPAKARMASRTVWSLQPTAWVIRCGRSPRALASRIWQRRRVNALGDRRPAVS